MKRTQTLRDVVPAQTGIQRLVMNESRWLPAFVATTRVGAEPDHA
jgi:hypothetical protein